MMLKATMILCFMLLLTQNLPAEEEPGLKLSQRYLTADSTTLNPSNVATYHNVIATLKGLNIVETVKTVDKLREAFKTVNANEDIKNKEDRWSAKTKAMHSIFKNHPGSLLSLLWPFFLMSFSIWFIWQYKKVFIERIKF